MKSISTQTYSKPIKQQLFIHFVQKKPIFSMLFRYYTKNHLLYFSISDITYEIFNFMDYSENLRQNCPVYIIKRYNNAARYWGNKELACLYLTRFL